MSKTNIRDYLASHPFFRDLPDPYLDTLAGHAEMQTFNTGQKVFSQDAAADHFYVVFSGEIEVEIPALFGAPVELDRIPAGKILGWSWLVPPYKWHFDARAYKDVMLICLDGKSIREKCESDPELGFTLLKKFAQLMGERLQAARLNALRQDS